LPAYTGRTMRRLACLLMLLLACGAGAAPVTLADGVWLVPGGMAPGRQPDGNSVLFDGPDGTVAVDSGRHVEHTMALLAATGARPLRALVNTHWHLDHLGGNLLLRRQLPELRVYASAAVAQALAGWLADSRRQMQGLLADAGTDAATRQMLAIDIALIDAGPMLLPDVVLSGPREIGDAGRPLQIGFEAGAVTAGDLWLFDPRSRVLAAGDLVTLPVPFFDTACAPRWSAALARVEAVDFERLVPGHGPVLSRADFQRYRLAFDGLLTCAAGSATAEACTQGWIDALGPLLPAADERTARGMLGYYVKQHLRAAPAQRDRFC